MFRKQLEFSRNFLKVSILSLTHVVEHVHISLLPISVTRV